MARKKLPKGKRRSTPTEAREALADLTGEDKHRPSMIGPVLRRLKRMFGAKLSVRKGKP